MLHFPEIRLSSLVSVRPFKTSTGPRAALIERQKETRAERQEARLTSFLMLPE
jgi:hypothetical protein